MQKTKFQMEILLYQMQKSHPQIKVFFVMSRWACLNHNFAFEGLSFGFVEAKRTKQNTSIHNKTIAKSAPSLVIYDISDSYSWS